AVTEHNRPAELDPADWSPVEPIAGEEIDTADGELIGLFLRRAAPVGLPAVETARWIRDEGGLVYLQHPGYRFVPPRLRLTPRTRAARVDEGLVDVVEVANAGAFMGHANRTGRRLVAAGGGIVAGAGSDAHHPPDIGRCYVVASRDEPFGALTPQSLKEWLAEGTVVDRHPRAPASLAPRAGVSARQLRRRPRGAATTSRGRPRAP